MKDKNLIRIISSIEDVILENEGRESYRTCVIATMKARKYTLADADRICRENVLFFDLYSNNLTLALKNKLNMNLISQVSDEKFVNYVIRMVRSKSDEPLSIIANETKEMILAGRELVSEIKKAMIKHKDDDRSLPISVLFEENVQKRAEELIVESFEYFKFENEAHLLFTRSDSTQVEKMVEAAISYAEMNIGFSRRPYIPDDSGMLYVDSKEEVRGFITTGVCRPLSVAYIKGDGTISEIVDRKADDRTGYYNKEAVMYVLEMTQGWFEKNRIKAGDKMQVLGYR